MLNQHHVFAVILAGGSGTRFWPKSRETRPKQLCQIGSEEKTMIELTLDRLDGFIPPAQRLIVTHAKQMEATKTIVGKTCGSFIAEPKANNTAAALCLAALELHERDPEAVMVSLHADHIIKPIETFRNDITRGVGLAEKGFLTLLGIKPTKPDTGFGYIECGKVIDSPHAFQVERFKEKPNIETAKGYLATGRFLWNSGLFIWQAKTILEELRAHLPKTVNILEDARKTLNKPFSKMNAEELAPYYERLEKISIDHAVFEKSSRVGVVACGFDWLDIGSWSALEENFPVDQNGNLTFGDGLLIDTKNTTVDSDSYLVATVGVSDLIVVVSGGAVLVCPKSRAQDVKLIVEELKKRDRANLT